jgi:hypothetical protein
MGMYLACQ